jgi:signal transduction histidine kinase
VRLFKATVAKRADVRVYLAPNLPPICADLSQIRQVVMNLLTNAWEALRNGEGLIRVETSLVSASPAEETASATQRLRGSHVRLEVKDTGCGIPDEGQTRIFDPFYTTKFLGRGLGLSAVLGIVRSLGGTIHLQSIEGRGSTFEVQLPCGGASAEEYSRPPGSK